MSIKTFNIRDIDPYQLRNRAFAEAESIHVSQGKGLFEARMDCLKGHPAEINLLNCGYIDNLEKYMDVNKPDGTPVDCKVIVYKGSAHFITALRENRRRAMIAKRQYTYAEELYQYALDNKTGDYCLEEIAVWDGVTFKIQYENK
jgi:hypothetical protein